MVVDTLANLFKMQRVNFHFDNDLLYVLGDDYEKLKSTIIKLGFKVGYEPVT